MPARMWRYLDHPGPMAFAHRGGTDAAPENTVAAFSHAVGLGYRYLETDVHRTSDGVLVAFHDSGLERVTGAEGTISEHRWDDLRTIDLGDGHTIPTLDELLETFPSSRFNIDPKSDDAVDPLISAIQVHDAIDRVCIGSFSDRRIARTRTALGPRLCTSAGPRAATRIIAGLVLGRGSWTGGHAALQIPPSIGPIEVNRRLVDNAHRRGLHVHVWTVNDEPTMRELLDAGVDAVMTDETELLRTVMTDRGQWSPSSGG